MEGPTPVSALLHAATMVTAGIFVLIKFSWLIFLDLKVVTIILFVGIFTNFLASLTSMFQNDIKKIVAYSTSSQLGLIFISFGILKNDLAFFHIFNHAFFKALLFMLSGIIIHMFNNRQDYRVIVNLNANLYFVYIYTLVASFTLVGLPYLSAFYSKEVMIQSSFLNAYVNSFLSLFFLYISIFTTILYTFKAVNFLFYKNNVFILKIYYKECKDAYLYIILFILAMLSLFCGFFYKIVCCSSFVKTFSLSDPFLVVELEKCFSSLYLEITFYFILFLFSFSLFFSFYKYFFINNFKMFSNKINILFFIANKKFLFDSIYYYFIFLFFAINSLFIYIFDKVLLESNIRRYTIFFKFSFFNKSKIFNLNFLNVIFFALFLIILNFFCSIFFGF